MKINRNKIMAAGFFALALGIPSAAQVPASEILKGSGAIHHREEFKVLHMTPVNNDFEDCFNDSEPENLM